MSHNPGSGDQAEERHRCVGCGHRWEGRLRGAELCGDCWRRVQPILHGTVAPDAAAKLREFTAGIRNDVRRTVEQVDAIYDGDKRRNAIVATATLIAEVAEAGLDQLDAAIGALTDQGVIERG